MNNIVRAALLCCIAILLFLIIRSFKKDPFSYKNVAGISLLLLLAASGEEQRHSGQDEKDSGFHIVDSLFVQELFQGNLGVDHLHKGLYV